MPVRLIELMNSAAHVIASFFYEKPKNTVDTPRNVTAGRVRNKLGTNCYFVSFLLVSNHFQRPFPAHSTFSLCERAFEKLVFVLYLTQLRSHFFTSYSYVCFEEKREACLCGESQTFNSHLVSIYTRFTIQLLVL